MKDALIASLHCVNQAEERDRPVLVPVITTHAHTSLPNVPFRNVSRWPCRMAAPSPFPALAPSLAPGATLGLLSVSPTLKSSLQEVISLLPGSGMGLASGSCGDL